MAACDVWKQTHKKFYNVLLFATHDGVSEPLIQDSSSSNQDEALEFQSDSLLSSELLSNSIFLTIEGNIIDSYDTGDDDIVCGIPSGDDDIDETENYFAHTHFNCLPVLMMEWHDHQYVYDEDGIISDVVDAHSCVQSGITLYNDELNTMCTNDPCTINYGLDSALDGEDGIFVPSTVTDSPAVSNSSGVFNDIVIVSAQQQQKPQVQLNLEIDNAIIFPSGFYSLQQFLDDLNGILLNDRISISFLNKLQFVFVNSKNSYVYCPFVLHDDYDLDAETCSLQSLVYIFEDLDIEYGDMIGVSHFDTISNPSSINNVTNTNNENIKSLSKDVFGNTQSDGLNTHLNLQCGMQSQYQYRSDKSSQSIDDICNNGEWNSMSFTFTKNNGECGGTGRIDLSVIVNQNKSQVATSTGFDNRDTCSIGCSSICNSFSDITSTNVNSSIDSTISCGTSTNSSNFEPLFTSLGTAQLQNNNKVCHRKHRNKRKRKRKKHKWIPKHKFFCVKDVINELFYYSHKYGNQVGVTKTSLDRLVFLMVNDKNKIVKFESEVQMQKLPNHEQSSNFYPLRSLINTLLELDVEYGNRIGITKQSFGKLKMLFIGYSIDEIDEAVTNNTNMFY